MTSKNQEWLLKAAKRALDFQERIMAGRAMRGMYEDITVGRDLAAAIEAVENDVLHAAAKLMAEGRY